MGATDRRVGATLAGKYKIVRLIGTGSMGEVYEAIHVSIGRRVALKLMNSLFADSPEVVARFRREARAASAIESDYIVEVFDAGSDPTLGLYLASELLVGEDLEARLMRDRRLEPSLVATIGYQVARGLAKAHAAGVIHRDLKPANVFLTTRDDGSTLAKLLDFGISKVSRKNDDEPGSKRDGVLTEVGLTLGTPQYMSPEQAMAEPDIDGRADVWSLAALLYEAVSGVPVFANTGSAFSILMSVLKGNITPLDDVAPWVPDGLAAIIHDGLVRDRNARIPDATTFAQRLITECPEAAGSMSGRFSVADLRMVAAALEVQVRTAELDEETAYDDEEDAPSTVREPMVFAEDDYASASEDETPSIEKLEAAERHSSSPPSASEQVEVFHRLVPSGSFPTRKPPAAKDG